MAEFVQAVWGGILVGSVYGLMALGLTLVWGALRLLNLAHGSMFIVGAYAALAMVTVLNLPILVGLLAGVIAAGVTGFIMHVVFIRPVLGKPGFDNATLIATVGVSIALQAAALLVFGPSVKVVPEVITGAFTVGGTLITAQGLLVIAVAVILFLAINLFLKLSRYGMAIRAVSQQMEAASLMAVPVESTYAIVMVLSAALAGLAGVLLSSFFYLSPISGFNPMIQALIVTIFGGLGSVRGTIVAAYVVGTLGSFLQVYLGASWALPGVFLFIILVLIVRPNGLFGLAEARRL
jgi:branched-chain amino acid transport system permease protein